MSRPSMIPNFFNLLARRDTAHDYETAFVRDVSVERRTPRNPQIERLLVLGWVLIAAKSGLVWWACSRYQMPFNALWVILPTIAFALLCTAVYCWRR